MIDQNKRGGEEEKGERGEIEKGKIERERQRERVCGERERERRVNQGKRLFTIYYFTNRNDLHFRLLDSSLVKNKIRTEVPFLQ